MEAHVYKPYDDGTRAQNQLRIIIRNATTGTVLSRQVVLNQNRTTDGVGLQPTSTLNRTASATVTLNPGHRYEVFLAAESTAVVGYYGIADAKITASVQVSPPQHPRINEVRITF